MTMPVPQAAKPTPKPVSEMTDEEAQRRLDKIREKLAGFNERLRITQRDLDQRNAELEQSKKAAKESFGTDNVEALEANLLENRRLNASDIQECEEMLSRIQADLDRISASDRQG